MENAPSFFASRSQSINYESILEFSHLSPKVQSHLRRVYSTLSLAVLFSAVGVYAHIAYNLGGPATHFAAIACITGLMLTPRNNESEGKRWWMLMGCGFFQGCSIGNLVESVLFIDPSIVGVAFAGTLAIFACFSASAALAKRRSLLYLGGFLSSALSTMLMMTIAGWIFGASGHAMYFQLYGGLLVFCGYILFDTQLIIEKASNGDTDHVAHALELFLDFVAIFVRLLIILGRKSEEKEKRQKRSDRR